MGNIVGGEDVDLEKHAISLSHFNLLRNIGRGSFGKVRMVEHRGTKNVYALKYISKNECIQAATLNNIFRERDLLEEIEHSFVCNLKFAFQDDDYMYMVTQLMIGGDLRFQLNQNESWPENVVRFWIAEIACGLHYLHEKGIVHRDIKPDNVLLDALGHVAITDLNIAAKYIQGRPLSGLSGTYTYMAPEVFLGNGYYSSVDWWSLGVMLYEFLYGTRPFNISATEGLATAILNQNIYFPAKRKNRAPVSPESMDLTRKLLARDPDVRIGCGQGGFGEFMNHPWFQDMQWADLESKSETPPFAPNPDKINFDATYDLEELLLEDCPLEAQPRKRNPRAKHTLSLDMQLIEERFKDFDYYLYERYRGYVDPERFCVGEPPIWVKCVDLDKVDPKDSEMENEGVRKENEGDAGPEPEKEPTDLEKTEGKKLRTHSDVDSNWIGKPRLLPKLSQDSTIPRFPNVLLLPPLPRAGTPLLSSSPMSTSASPPAADSKISLPIATPPKAFKRK